MPSSATSSPATESAAGNSMKVATCPNRGETNGLRGPGGAMRSELRAQRGHGVGEERDVLRGAVDREARPGGARDAVASHQRLGAVMARPHGDPLLVQQRGD